MSAKPGIPYLPPIGAQPIDVTLLSDPSNQRPSNKLQNRIASAHRRNFLESPRAENLWDDELAKFLFQDVQIFTGDGDVISGQCRAIRPDGRAAILMTDDSKTLHCNFVWMKRKRTPRP